METLAMYATANVSTESAPHTQQGAASHGLILLPLDGSAAGSSAFRVARALARGSGTVVDPVLIVGNDPAQQIARLAEERESSLIVLGTHAGDELNRPLRGCIAERVVALVRVPVVLVPRME